MEIFRVLYAGLVAHMVGFAMEWMRLGGSFSQDTHVLQEASARLDDDDAKLWMAVPTGAVATHTDGWFGGAPWSPAAVLEKSRPRSGESGRCHQGSTENHSGQFGRDVWFNHAVLGLWFWLVRWANWCTNGVSSTRIVLGTMGRAERLLGSGKPMPLLPTTSTLCGWVMGHPITQLTDPFHLQCSA